jgi:hypothetical protein
MTIMVKSKQGKFSFRWLVSILRKMGAEIISMRPNGGYMIITLAMGKKTNPNWVNTMVLQNLN